MLTEEDTVLSLSDFAVEIENMPGCGVLRPGFCLLGRGRNHIRSPWSRA